jgi:hypothetical protein
MTTKASADRIELTNHWLKLFNCPPPIQSNTEFLRRAVGWQVQLIASGGLDKACRKTLMRGAVTTILALGTILIRQWRDVSHQVTVTDAGFEYTGKRFRSLSAIAKAITGTQWNGRVFFGVKS